MNYPDLSQLALVIAVGLPGAAFLLLGAAWLAGWEPSERVLARLSNAANLTAVAAAALLAVRMVADHLTPVTVNLGHWFHTAAYHFDLILFADRLSLPLLVMTLFLVYLIGAFSSTYLHRERGYFRFFLMLHLFAFGAVLVFSAGSLSQLIGGWELIGITSVLLIAFFGERPEPVRSAFRVFAIYRACDLGLLSAVFALHHLTGSADFDALLAGAWPHQSASLAAGPATWIGLLLLLAACGKSAQIPFSGWLPRAMEGPTPSSAIFYGGIAVHCGAYLLLRMSPLLAVSPVASAAVVTVGLLTAFHGTFVGRASVDAKTQLAYATVTQLGLIFVEIGLGFPTLALFHILGHAIVRTLQLLRAPSMLREFHQMHHASGGRLAPTGAWLASLVPMAAQRWLYRLALERGFHDAALDRLVATPLTGLARRLAAVDHFLAEPSDGPAVSQTRYAADIADSHHSARGLDA